MSKPRAEIDQLRAEAAIEPMLVSLALKDLMEYIDSNLQNDMLASGFPNQNDNPYKEKAGCLVS